MPDFGAPQAGGTARIRRSWRPLQILSGSFPARPPNMTPIDPNRYSAPCGPLRWITRQNVGRYKRKLEPQNDEAARQVLLRLLAAEESKLENHKQLL
jgi:hypothetical protein